MARQRGPNQRHWCFTSYLDVLPVQFNKDIVRYCCYQREICPETKREHFQGYIEFFDCKRMGQVKSVLGQCHLEARRGSRNKARAYCRKVESAMHGTQVEFGLWREDLSRKRKLCDMLRSDMSLKQLIVEDPLAFVRYYRGLGKLFEIRSRDAAKEPRKVTVICFIGPTGSGKTRRAVEEPDHFIMPLSDKMWFDGYAGETCLIIDDFDGGILYRHFLRILDRYELQVPIKGGFVWARWTKVIITSNLEPDAWYPKEGFSAPLRRRIKLIYHLPIHIIDLSDSSVNDDVDLAMKNLL